MPSDPHRLYFWVAPPLYYLLKLQGYLFNYYKLFVQKIRRVTSDYKKINFLIIIIDIINLIVKMLFYPNMFQFFFPNIKWDKLMIKM